MRGDSWRPTRWRCRSPAGVPSLRSTTGWDDERQPGHPPRRPHHRRKAASWEKGRDAAEASCLGARRARPGRYPWGDELTPGGEHRCNIWQGRFPMHDTAPVDAFAPNGFGLYNVAGNVWEWCADWFDRAERNRAMRGGSYLCHESYCNPGCSSHRPNSPTDPPPTNGESIAAHTGERRHCGPLEGRVAVVSRRCARDCGAASCGVDNPVGIRLELLVAARDAGFRGVAAGWTTMRTSGHYVRT
ncbi:formylglycine-generating enzyme family protein [Pseudonocardia hierapolitana]|uniref:formylglycine-generating enzyme family protein n=1 Tax=Pseudonocardia hierapolitana TaxID=1128676 RepID=UPI003CCC621E